MKLFWIIIYLQIILSVTNLKNDWFLVWELEVIDKILYNLETFPKKDYIINFYFLWTIQIKFT